MHQTNKYKVMELVKCYFDDGSYRVAFRDEQGSLWLCNDGTARVAPGYEKIEPLFPKKEEFTKDDLQDGDICVNRLGGQERAGHVIEKFNHDLTSQTDEYFDIVAVYRNPIWTRNDNDTKEMTIEEIQEKLGHKVKIIDEQTRS